MPKAKLLSLRPSAATSRRCDEFGVIDPSVISSRLPPMSCAVVVRNDDAFSAWEIRNSTVASTLLCIISVALVPEMLRSVGGTTKRIRGCRQRATSARWAEGFSESLMVTSTAPLQKGRT
eukprot:scaffold2469_cov239-Pinguiococcus_pyrenoidosus.AAC.10